jgi:hypothetical protein
MVVVESFWWSGKYNSEGDRHGPRLALGDVPTPPSPAATFTFPHLANPRHKPRPCQTALAILYITEEHSPMLLFAADVRTPLNLDAR